MLRKAKKSKVSQSNNFENFGWKGATKKKHAAYYTSISWTAYDFVYSSWDCFKSKSETLQTSPNLDINRSRTNSANPRNLTSKGEACQIFSEISGITFDSPVVIYFMWESSWGQPLATRLEENKTALVRCRDFNKSWQSERWNDEEKAWESMWLCLKIGYLGYPILRHVLIWMAIGRYTWFSYTNLVTVSLGWNGLVASHMRKESEHDITKIQVFDGNHVLYCFVMLYSIMFYHGLSCFIHRIVRFCSPCLILFGWILMVLAEW